MQELFSGFIIYFSIFVASLRSRMSAVIYVDYTVLGKAHEYPGSHDIFITHQFLERLQVGTILYHVSGKGIAQYLRTDLVAEAAFFTVILDDLPYSLPGKGLSEVVYK